MRPPLPTFYEEKNGLLIFKAFTEQFGTVLTMVYIRVILTNVIFFLTGINPCGKNSHSFDIKSIKIQNTKQMYNGF